MYDRRFGTASFLLLVPGELGADGSYSAQVTPLTASEYKRMIGLDLISTGTIVVDVRCMRIAKHVSEIRIERMESGTTEANVTRSFVGNGKSLDLKPLGPPPAPKPKANTKDS